MAPSAAHVNRPADPSDRVKPTRGVAAGRPQRTRDFVLVLSERSPRWAGGDPSFRTRVSVGVGWAAALHPRPDRSHARDTREHAPLDPCRVRGRSPANSGLDILLPSLW